MIERAAIACDGDLITPQLLTLPQTKDAPRPSADTLTLPVGTTVEEAEKQLILKTLDSVRYNKTRAAEILGISLKTLHNKLHRYGTGDASQP